MVNPLLVLGSRKKPKADLGRMKSLFNCLKMSLKLELEGRLGKVLLKAGPLISAIKLGCKSILFIILQAIYQC
jgi:hypothetical protein